MAFDFHTHVFPPDVRRRREIWLDRDATLSELFADPKAKMASAEDLIEAMEQDGVHRSVAMGIGWTDAGLARESNDYLIEAAARYPGRIVPFCSVNPGLGAAAANEVDRCARLGARGIGELHPDTQRLDYSAIEPILEVADAHSLVITTHSSEPVGHAYPGKGTATPQTLMRLIEAARDYRNVRIVCAHWGGGLPFYALMPEVRDALSNVWFDTAASPFLYTPSVFAAVASIVGADKILTASDFPLIRFRRIRRHVERAGMRLSDFSGDGPLAVGR